VLGPNVETGTDQLGRGCYQVGPDETEVDRINLERISAELASRTAKRCGGAPRTPADRCGHARPIELSFTQ
jgi:hypothetical protein